MERLRYVVMGTMLVVAFTGTLTARGQHTAAESASAATGGENQEAATQTWVPTVEQQMKVFTEQLNLGADQQAKIRPIVQRLHDFTMKVVQDPRLSHEERVVRVRPEHEKAHEELMKILTDEQKEMLEKYMQGPHPELHWNLGGRSSSQPQQPQN